ncbi:MAG: methyltransferase RsmF C-terminal domain-like protein [Thermoproteota archaeon]
MRAEILGKKDKEKIFEELKDRFGFVGELPYGFLRIQDRIKVVSRDFRDIQLEGLVIEDLGLLFGEWVEGKLILSIEGSQMIGPNASKNVIELDFNQMKRWMTGGAINIESRELEEGPVILKHKRDFLGCGKLSQGKIWSTIPPHRRINQK